MPQTIHRGIKSLIDEANAEIETVSASDAIKAAQSEGVVIVDIRDPREIERDGKLVVLRQAAGAVQRLIVCQQVSCVRQELPGAQDLPAPRAFRLPGVLSE